MSAPLRLPIGLHDDVPAADYHRDPAESPSLSSSVAKIILAATPLHAWTAHPRLNPAYQAETDPKFDRGSVAHELILGRGAGYEVVEAEDWRSKAAKEARDDARSRGFVPILGRHALDSWAMARSVVKRMRDIPDLAPLLGQSETCLANGLAERVMIWRDIGGALCRAMIDFHGPAPTAIWDIKTTGALLDDETRARQIVNLGHDVQAAFYLRGLSQLMPDLAGRFRWRWIVVEDSPPFEVRVIEPLAELLEIGDRKAALAIEKWRRCVETGLWPGYPPHVTRIGMPAWASERWLERERTDPDADAMVLLNHPVSTRAPELLGPY
jgi:PDDEXK-like domain of unknown function (DUF3799)